MPKRYEARCYEVQIMPIPDLSVLANWLVIETDRESELSQPLALFWGSEARRNANLFAAFMVAWSKA